jgi:hypothetical protein
MKKVTTIIIGFVLATLLSLTDSFSQGVYDLRIVHQSLDCAKKTVVVSVEIKATSADSSFKLEGGNIRVMFTTNQLTNPRFKSRDGFSGGKYEVMDSLISMTTNGASGLFTANIVNAVGATDGTLVGINWTKMFTLEFDVAASSTDKCYNLTLMANPPAASKVTKIISSGVGAVASKGVYTNIVNQCPVKPVVALTSASGQSSELTLTLQAGDFPVMVTISGGLMATMTQTTAKVAIAPATQTTYTIDSISNQCTVGLAAAGAGSVTVTPSSNGGTGCINVMCIPVTARVIKL